MLQEMTVLEGFFIKYLNAIWIVKGIDYCGKYIIAYPRYDLKGRKLSKYHKTSLIKQLVKLNDCSPRPSPLVPLWKSEVIDPRDLIERDELARDMASIFNCKFGLTGSRAWNESGKDVDLITYDWWCDKEIMKVMRELRERGVTEPPKEGKWDGLLSGAKRYRARNALLEGVWNGVPYSFRIVGPPRSPRRAVSLGFVKLCGKLRPISNVVMPYIYELVTNNGTIRVESLRIQHSELGEVKVCVRGSLEVRIDGTFVTLPPGATLDVVG